MTDRQLKEVLGAEVLALTQLKERLERSKERLVLLELWATGHGYQHPDWPSQSQT